MSKRTLCLAVALCAALAGGPALAADSAPPQGVVSLSASASLEVVRDLLTVTLSTTRESTDAATVQSQLKQALDAALAEAKRAAKPGQIEVQTGNFSISPRYTNKGASNGWQGSAELVVEGRDMQAIGQLTGRITTLTIARVGYNLSRELREKSEGEVSAQAIARFRAKAADYAKQFGYTGYAIREVNVNGNEQLPPRGVSMQMKAMAASAEEALPVEPGKGTVTVNVAGTVQMNR
jgi:predicted secreted protein